MTRRSAFGFSMKSRLQQVIAASCAILAAGATVMSIPASAYVEWTDEMGYATNGANPPWTGTYTSNSSGGNPSAPCFWPNAGAANLITRTLTYHSAIGTGNGQTYKCKLSCNMYTTNAASTLSHRYRLSTTGSGTVICGATHTAGNTPYFQYYNGAFSNGSALAAGWHAMSITHDLTADSKITYVIPGGTYTYNPSISTLPTAVNVGTSASSGDQPGFDHVVFEDWWRPSASISSPSAAWAKQGDVVNYTITYGDYAGITLAASHVTVNQSGVSGSTGGTVTGSGATRTVPVTAGSGDGTVSISIAAGTATSNDGAASPTIAFGPSAVFNVDNTDPTNPTATCTDGKPTDTWRNNASPTFTLAGASDGGSGLKTTGSNQRYRYYFGTDANGAPATGTDSTSVSPTTSGDGTYYLRVQTQDNVGNWSSPATVFVFKHDATAPTVTTSPSFVSANAGYGTDVSVRWTAGSFSDATAGLAANPLAVYEGTEKVSGDLAASATEASFAESGGTYSYVLKVEDNAGNKANALSITNPAVGVPAAANNPWIFTTPAVSLAPPGVYPAADSKVFASSDSKLYAFGGNAAAPLWDPVPAGGAIMGRAIPATVASQLTVLAGAQDNKVYARSVADGTERWTHDFGSDYKVTAKPAGIKNRTVDTYTGDIVFAATDSGANSNKLRALRADTGAELWTYVDGASALGPILGSPLVLPTKNLVVFATSTGVSINDTGRVVAVNIADGTFAWEFASGEVKSAVGTDGSESTIFVVNETGGLYALNSTNGSLIYGPISLGSAGIYGTPTWHGNGPRLYISSQGDAVYALDPATGGTAAGWSGSISVTRPSNPVVFNQGLYIGSSDGYLHEYAITTGAPTGSRQIGSTVGDPVVDAYLARIYAGAGDGRIYSFTTPF